jgi:hypothetical protein
MGMFYRWHVDLCGPFPASTFKSQYVMICVESFSKHAELIPMPDKSSETCAFHFLHNVIARFGACAEVVTEQGTEFDGKFAALLSDAQIDHRRASANHSQSNGLAERCVQTLKICLKKVLDGNAARIPLWDVQVAWIALRIPHYTSGVDQAHSI